jgi:hypothetical protein
MANYVRAESLGEMYDSSRRDEITPTRRKWLHKKMKEAELYGREMPFQIGSKRKLSEQPRNYWVACDECGREMAVSKITYAVICSGCGSLCKVETENG